MTDALQHWTRVDIGGKPADVFEPEGGRPYEACVVFLHPHGLETLAGDEVFSRELARYGLPCVCPHGGRTWWLDQVCAEFDEAVSPMAYVRETVVEWIGKRWGVVPPQIGLLGISMGGQGALQLAYRDARRFPVVAAISPAIDFHILHGHGSELDRFFESAEAARQQTVTLHLHPLGWPPQQLFVCDPTDVWHEGCDRLASKLRSMGIPFESDLTTRAGGHSWVYFRAMAPRCVAFVSAGLGKVAGK